MDFLINVLQRNILSFFGSGLLRFAPGTMGSFAAWVLCTILFTYFHLSSFLISMGIFCFVIGTISCYFYLKESPKETDPGWIVIDEAAAVMIGMGALYVLFPGLEPWQSFCFFVIFRFFDILKPWPISAIEDSLKGTPVLGALGIMVDDIVAALFAFIVYFFVSSLFTT